VVARPEVFAIAAADGQDWEAARDLTLRGTVATWLGDRRIDRKIVANFRRIVSDENLSEDLRHALALMALNPSLPATHGETKRLGEVFPTPKSADPSSCRLQGAVACLRHQACADAVFPWPIG
jgi:hypothetical protein